MSFGLGFCSPHQIAFADNPQQLAVIIDHGNGADPAVEHEPSDLMNIRFRRYRDDVPGHYVHRVHVGTSRLLLFRNA